MSRWTIVVTSPGQLDVDSFLPDKDKLTITPNFFGTGDSANSGVIKVFDSNNKLLSTTLLIVAGSTGKIKIRDISRPVAPAAEQQANRKSKPKKEPNVNVAAN